MITTLTRTPYVYDTAQRMQPYRVNVPSKIQADHAKHRLNVWADLKQAYDCHDGKRRVLALRIDRPELTDLEVLSLSPGWWPNE